MLPWNFIHPWISFDVALKIDIGAFSNASAMALLISAELQRYDWNVWKSEQRKQEEEKRVERNFITEAKVFLFAAFHRTLLLDGKKKILIHYFTPQKVLSLNPFFLHSSPPTLISEMQFEHFLVYARRGAPFNAFYIIFRVSGGRGWRIIDT